MTVKCLIKLKKGRLECWFDSLETVREFINFTRVKYTRAKIYIGGKKHEDKI